MMTIANYSFTVDADLMKQFEELACADAEYDSWLKAKVSRSMEMARSGGLIDDEQVEAEFSARREASRPIS